MSEQQIKDLSRGLFIHYKLNQPERSENLLTNTYDKITTNTGYYTIENVFYGTPAMHRYRTGVTSTTWSEVQFFYDFTPGIYTFSIYTKDGASSDFELVFRDVKNGVISDTVAEQYSDSSTSNTWQKRIYKVGVPNKSFVTPRLFYTNAYNFDYYLARPKLEKGWNPSPQWTPAYSDNISWDNTEYDGSGFCDHGQLIGSVTADFTTPRYDLAYSFNNSGYIKNDNFNCTVDKCTISFWIKPKSSISSQHFIFGTQNNWMQNGIAAWYDPGYETSMNIYYVTNTGAAQYAITQDIDTWQMITLVTDGTKYYSYKNAQLVESQDLIYNSIYNPVLYVGNSLYGDINAERAECSLSDFRFYTSALSADAIKEIYNYRK